MSESFPYRHLLGDGFTQACRDYFYLVDRHFPEKGSLKLVGDRYRLTGDERTVVYRGIASQKLSLIRKELLTSSVTGKHLLIDGYNVLFTLLNYRYGKIIFIGTDNILRDAGSLHGKLKDYTTLDSCIDLLVNSLAILKPSNSEVYLDAPVSHSEKHAFMIREKMKACGLDGDSTVVKSADRALKNGRDCVIATSDTGIIDRALLPVFDLARSTLENVYRAGFLDLGKLLAANKAEDSVDEG